MLGGMPVGGRFISMPQARAMTVPGGPAFGFARVGYKSRFPEIIAGLQIHSNAASKAEAEEILEAARDNITDGPYPIIEPSTGPVWRTGALWRSLYVTETDWLEQEHGSEEWIVASDLEYAPMVHFGSIHNYGPGGGRAKPFLTDAVNERRPHFIAREAAAIKAACA
jgi:hypothetical protein